MTRILDVGELDVTEEPEVQKSEAKIYEESLGEMAVKEGKMIQRITQILEVAMPVMKGSFLEYFFGVQFARDKGKEEESRGVKRQANLVSKKFQTTPELGGKCTSDLRKRQKKPNLILQEAVTQKPEETSREEEEWFKAPARKDLRKKKPKLKNEKPEWPKRARSESVIIKLSEGFN